MPMLLLRARYIFPVAGDPIPDGLLAIEDGRIAWLGASRTCPPGRSPDVQDLGNVAILPGLVNAHSHLDFSGLTSRLGHRGISLPDWIRQAVAYRIRTPELRHAIASGLHESLSCGVTMLGDIVQPDCATSGAGTPSAPSRDRQDACGTTPSLTALVELIAPTKRRVTRRWNWPAHISGWSGTPPMRPDGNPAWPPTCAYSVHPNLLATIVEISAAERVPVAMHLAESAEELELLRRGAGPMREMLEEFAHGMPRRSPADCARSTTCAFWPRPTGPW